MCIILESNLRNAENSKLQTKKMRGINFSANFELLATVEGEKCQKLNICKSQKDQTFSRTFLASDPE